MTDWCVTINLGGPRQSAVAQEGMLAWTQEIMAGQCPPLMIFAQETFPEWLRVVRAAGYEVIEGVDRQWKVRSGLVVDKALSVRGLTEADLPHLFYHGNYVSAGLWKRPDGSEAVLASVHASPSYAEPERYGWPSDAGHPKSRHGGSDPRWPNHRLWDSDYLLMTLRHLGDTFDLPLLAAGDFNESLLDDPEGGTWGSEFFSNADSLGVSSWLHEEWRDDYRHERPTRTGLQLDHILVARGGEKLLRSDPAPETDVRWADPRRARRLSDHAAIWFALAEQP
ncbi:endonuclease/exonuclease/phosphatase family protein [Nocardioides agariphilus]|uniref:Endonuclease/exonuclease/phosphatase family protein n=1 Tax=Nocardioides agariphilus TaxID=433664 RepID=A0A930YFK9_9ACTN|nr:endonuclease/exonuclease/phosphatase family protein [Nocardioides agariphilus]MBF4766616.1 endonuclease/exonuclease/phosphatase family protein [Nocardioides agariphilus]